MFGISIFERCIVHRYRAVAGPSPLDPIRRWDLKGSTVHPEFAARRNVAFYFELTPLSTYIPTVNLALRQKQHTK
jgi:hypothetical protein